MPRRKENISKAKENGHAVGTQCKSTKSLPFSVCLFVSVAWLILHADLLRTGTLGNFRWCCNVLAVETSSLFCLKCSMGAFFSSFIGSAADCFCAGLQEHQVVLGGEIIFVIFYFRITNLITVTNLSVIIFLMVPHSLIFLVLLFTLSW